MNDRRDADGFDGVLSQMTEPDASRAPDRKAANAPADRGAQSDTPATVAHTPGRDASGAARRDRVAGQRGDADDPALEDQAKTSNDEQTISATLSWLLAGIQTVPVPSPVKVPADAGGSGDQPGGSDGKNASGEPSAAASGSSTSALEADAANVRAQAAVKQAANQTEHDLEAGAPKAGDPKQQPIDNAAVSPIDQVSLPQNSGSPNPAGDRSAAKAANDAVASAKAHAVSAAATAADASSAGSLDGKTVPPVADSAAPGAQKIGAAERTSPSASAAAARLAANALGGNEAANQATEKSVAASSMAGAPAAESRPLDAHGSTRHDGAGAEDRRGDAPSPQAAGSQTPTHVVHAPFEMRAVGGATLAAGAVDAATSAGRTSAGDVDLPKQIVQAIRLQWNQGIGDARITLQPEYLGEMSIAIRVEHGAVSAELQSSVPAVREWIDSHQPMLRQALAAQGLDLQRLTTIDTPAASEDKRDGQSESHQQHEEPRQQRRRARSDAPAFELIA